MGDRVLASLHIGHRHRSGSDGGPLRDGRSWKSLLAVGKALFFFAAPSHCDSRATGVVAKACLLGSLYASKLQPHAALPAAAGSRAAAILMRCRMCRRGGTRLRRQRFFQV